MPSLGKSIPAWQTDELADEWIEEDEEEQVEAAEGAPVAFEQQPSTQAMHSTFNARGSCNFGTIVDTQNASPEIEQTTQVGTFVVHSEQPSAHVPLTPAFGKKKGLIKDIFSPLQLERLFEPPSPPKDSPSPLSTPTPQQRVASTSHHLLSSRPAKPSKLSQVIGASTLADDSELVQSEKQHDGIVETAMPNIVTFGQAEPTPTCRFTFAVPRSVPRFPTRISFDSPAAATSTPNDNSICKLRSQKTPFPTARTQRIGEQQPNLNDSRLRLFQFQYDTYTREHLSAIADSFGVSSPSNVSSSRQSAGTVFHRPPVREEGEVHEDVETFSRLRAAKRLKLTPPSEFTPEATAQLPAQDSRPAVKRDYVGEARSFMQKIRRARGLSLISNADAAEQEPQVLVETTNTQAKDAPFNNPTRTTSSTTTTVNTNNVFGAKSSSMAYRRQAEDLMAKIKGDPKVFSAKGDTSLASQKSDEDNAKLQERSWAPSPETRPTSPVKKQLEDKENREPELEPDPPSYAASIALTRGQFENQFIMKNQPANLTAHGVVVMPVTISEEVSPVATDRKRSPNPNFLGPPPTILGNMRFNAQVRSSSTNEDLNRLVSSGSTTTTATTLTVGSAGSGVKHAGPAQMVRIVPADLPSIPERVGSMIFDRALGRWVKERGASDKTVARSSTRRSSQGSFTAAEGFTESEDPFRDIESLRDEGPGQLLSPRDADKFSLEDINRSQDGTDGTDDMHINSSDSDSDFDDAEESQISTFMFDRPPTGVVKVMTGEQEDLSEIDNGDASTDSEDDTEVNNGNPVVEEDVDDGLYDDLASISVQDEQQIDEGASMALAALKREPCEDGQKPDNHRNPANNAMTPRKPPRRLVQPPRSALKSASVTPISRGGRSVSFSDGRKDGKILGLHAGQDRQVAVIRTPGMPASTSLPSAASARSKRIMEMLENVEDSLLDDEDQNSGREYMQAETMPHVPNNARNMDLDVGSPRSFTRSQTIRRPGQSSPRRVNTPSRANATFLTECSFGVAHDRLVEVITDVQPFEPYWESLKLVDLSGRKLDSVARLKEFLPKLDSLNLNDNLLSWLSGIPSSVRTLSVASNALTSLTSFGHLKNLENLDISYNDIDSLQQLKCLRHLRELRADGNKITKLDGLEDFDDLLKLSLDTNALQEVDFGGFRWSRLEFLNLSNNRLESVRELNAAPALVSLNLDNNFLSALDQLEDVCEKDHASTPQLRPLQKLRILRLSGNRLKYLDVARFPNLRTLYVDNNCLAEGRTVQRGQSQRRARQGLSNLHRLSKLENFSARNQTAPGARDSGLQLRSGDVRDIKRLYLSGNPSPILLGAEAQACYILVYLELAACRLTSLPADFSSLMPNIRALNLNYNFLESDEIARGLSGLNRLRKLTIVGNRMKGTKALVKMLSIMGQNIEMLDFRMNPCTLGWYLPLLVQDKDNGALLQPSEPANGKHHSPFISALPPNSTNPAGTAEGPEEAARRRSGTAPFSLAPGVTGPSSRSQAVGDSGKSKDKRSPSQWETLDAQFRRGLPNKAYAGRLAYRGLIMRACPQIQVLDGVRVTDKEKRKAEALLKRVLKEAVPAGIASRTTTQR